MRFGMWLTMAMGLMTTAATAAGPRGQTAEPPAAVATVRLVTIGAVEPALKTGVVAWIEDQVGPTRDDGALDGLAARGPVGMARVLATGAGSPPALTLALVADGAGRFPAKGLWTTNGIALVDLKTLQPGVKVSGDEARRYLWRIQREALHGLALAAGMEECPILYCALYDWQNERELDLKSRNPCPPCKDKFDTRLRDRGLPNVRPAAAAPGESAPAEP